MMVVEGGGGGVALVTFNSRRPLRPLSSDLWIFHGSRLVMLIIQCCTTINMYTCLVEFLCIDGDSQRSH